MGQSIHVIKLGGSLLDLPDMAQRVAEFVATDGGSRALLLVGGGAAADIVRAFDRRFGLDEEDGHWLAVRAMQLNAHLVAALLEAPLVVDPTQCEREWERRQLPVVDPLLWLEREEAHGQTVPHRWSFTSDSIAAHLARTLGAARLTLLKSDIPDSDCGTVRAAGLGVVDEDFPEASRGVPRVELLNLRVQPPARCVLR